jgi:Cu(I)/Ag(I) efflux system periplasmic protein CusF
MRSFTILAVLGALAAGPASAVETATSDAALSQGEIRRVDRDAKKLTIRHGAIAHLDMPPMTMVFQVADPAVLEQVKVGDKVRFAADKKDGAYVVTRVEADR